MTILLAVADWDLQLWRDRFAERLPGRKIVSADEGYDPSAIRYAAVWNPPAGLLASLPKLQAVFSLGAGVDALLADPTLPEVPLFRAVDPDLAMRMSEWVLLHVLIHHRRQPMYEWQQGAKIWAADETQPAAHQVRVGVMGLGALGADAASKLSRVGFDVAGWSASPKRIEGVESYVGPQDLDAFLARTEILVCLLPSTPQTAGILDRALFARLSQDGPLGPPIVLNASRGANLVEADLLEALEDGTLQAASLDVFRDEPLPEDSPLWRHPRLLISPHNAAMSSAEAVSDSVGRSIEAFEAGAPVIGLVDRARGY